MTRLPAGKRTQVADEQDRAELLDDDKQGDDYPPEEPFGLDDYGTTAAEELYKEPLAERLEREEPDGIPPPDTGVRLVQPDQGMGTDTEAQEVASLDTADPDLPAMRAWDPDAGSSPRDTATEREAGLSAEEDAVHVIDERQLRG